MAGAPAHTQPDIHEKIHLIPGIFIFSVYIHLGPDQPTGTATGACSRTDRAFGAD
jgi:hypothetical protein